MNESNQVGIAFGGAGGPSGLTPLILDAVALKKAGNTSRGEDHILAQLTPEQQASLKDYLVSRLDNGITARNRRAYRYSRIDRSISTWQKLDPTESARELIEDNTGKQMALPINLPILASHLNDMASYFCESLAPISNPFFSANPEGQVPELLKKFNRDAAARDYYGQLNLTVRSLLKYNLGGFELDWEEGDKDSNVYASRQPGNCWYGLDLYNTLWDPAIKQPKNIAGKAEWAATVCIENRLELIKKTLAGTWFGLEDMLAKATDMANRPKYYKSAASTATLGDEGQDTRTSTTSSGAVNWADYGLGLTTDLGPEVDGFEVVNMYCWLLPAQFGLLTNGERKLIEDGDRDPDTFLELWRFKIVAGDYVVDAKPALDRQYSMAGEVNEIPIYLTYLTEDQLREAQRSFMELMRGFQRFGSAMFNIYIAGMRKNVWGVLGVDESMFDASKLKQGDTTGVLPSKRPGADVRAGLMALSSNAGVDDALKAVDATIALKDKFFPAQSLPSQIAGIDRAVKSQVATVIQGAQRAMRTMLRCLDSGLMLPTRLCGFRNLKRYDRQGIEEMNDEDVAQMMGSGIESMEAERVSDALWQLTYAIIQSQEAMQTFNVPMLMTYNSRVSNLSVDLGQFVRAPQPQTPPPAAGAPPPDGQEQAPPPPPPAA
jgi:hypothetical protein